MTTAVGFFDGVHLGHQAILKGAEVALTFRNHPLSRLAPARAPQLIMSLEERLSAIRGCGVKEVIALDFNEELAAMPAEEFALRYLRGKVRSGANWRFGRDARGTPELLAKLGIGYEAVPYALWSGEAVSSTRIRQSLAQGKIGEAAAMLGRGYSANGRVVKGKGMGSGLGFPTVNVIPEIPLLVPFGVYSVSAGGFSAIANFGRAPTMRDQAWAEPVLEIHFPDGLSVPLAIDDRLRVEFVRFIRPEKKFASVDELKRQISADILSLRS